MAVAFSSQGSSDPDAGTTLTYAWNFGDGTTSTQANPSRTYTTNGAYDVTLTVSDGAKTGQATKRITVGSTAPTVNILTPVNNALYSAGDTVSFTGTASDAEDGTLPDSAYKWTVAFHHADHIHPFRDNIIGPSGSVVIPRGADNIDTTWYRITLTVTDSSGLSTSRSVDVKPRLVTLTFNANDPEASFTIDGIPKTGSYTEQAVVGVERVLGAPSPQYVGNGQFVFNNWSDGQAQTHTIITPGTNANYTVILRQSSSRPLHRGRKATSESASPRLLVTIDNGVFTVRGAGNDIWETTDEFHYVYQPFSGDGTIIARVTSQTPTDDWAKSGIIIKESPTAGQQIRPAGRHTRQRCYVPIQLQRRQRIGPVHVPQRLAQARAQGDVFKGYTSANGTDWTLVGQTTLV